MLEMLKLAENEGIEVRWWDFHPSILGLYWQPLNMPPVIGLHKSIEHDTPLLRTVMAEELGHHFTSSGMGLYHTFCHYRQRLDLSRIEYRALRWAAEYLMSNELMDHAVKSCKHRWELADYLMVTEDMLDFRLSISE
jgi:Zn-dependent peptidase ImmA (M78 family)